MSVQVTGPVVVRENVDPGIGPTTVAWSWTPSGKPDAEMARMPDGTGDGATGAVGEGGVLGDWEPPPSPPLHAASNSPTLRTRSVRNGNGSDAGCVDDAESATGGMATGCGLSNDDHDALPATPYDGWDRLSVMAIEVPCARVAIGAHRTRSLGCVRSPVE